MEVCHLGYIEPRFRVRDISESPTSQSRKRGSIAKTYFPKEKEINLVFPSTHVFFCLLYKGQSLKAIIFTEKR
jgi:hypothetical protein